MTDGILLAELQRDRTCAGYDTLIIDEAHERSLNIDFLLGYLHQLLPRRPDLKVIITSATIDPSGSRRHFGDAPVVEVSGRTYPVEVRYRPLGWTARTTTTRPPGRSSTPSTSCAAEGPGDILVFLSGEREIRDTADALRAEPPAATPRSCRSTPGCPPAEQHRVFAAAHRAPRSCWPPTSPRRRSPCPASGTSSTRARPASPATATAPRCSGCPSSRSRRRRPTSGTGRCGRTVRRHLHPALRRGRLRRPARVHRAGDPAHQPGLGHPPDDRASGLGDIAAFPFIDPPDRRSIADGVDLLEELGALDGAGAASCTARRAPARPAARSTRAWAAWCWRPDRQRLRARGPGDRRRAVHPGPARAAGRQAAGGRRAPRAASPTRTPTSSTYLNLWTLPARAAEGAVLQPVPRAVPGRVPQLPAGARVAGPATASCAQPVTRPRHHAQPASRADADQRPHRPAGRAALPHRPQGRATAASTWAPAAPGSRSSPVRRWPGSRRAG